MRLYMLYRGTVTVDCLQKVCCSSLPCRSEAAAQGLTTRTFVAARITDWPASSPFPLVEVRQSLGPTGDIDAGTAALLAGEGVKDEDFGLEVCMCALFNCP